MIALDEIKRNPHPGFTMKEVVQELTVELGRKIPRNSISLRLGDSAADQIFPNCLNVPSKK
ncbi:MAG: hypothetical protein IPL26_02070 [Leptospiraceae bacterium]|nr:hypothetical protein [Leptospiraceae bacterium]